MSYAPLIKPTNRVVYGAVESITWTEGFSREAGCKPGHVISSINKADGTDDFGVVRANCRYPILGFCGYEQSHLANPANPLDYGSMRPDSPNDAFAEGVPLPILFGGNACFMGHLARGLRAERGMTMASWYYGELVPGYADFDGITIMVPFSKHTSLYDSGFYLPEGIQIRNARVLVTTAVAGASIDVGWTSGEELINGASAVSVGYKEPVVVGTTTVGSALAGDALTCGADTLQLIEPYTTVTGQNLAYKTSDHTIAGYILLTVEPGQGIRIVAECQETTDTLVAVKQVPVRALI